MSKVKAVILCAGRGERLMPLTKNKPKPMLEVNGKPTLEHTIKLLTKYNINEIIINLHYLPDVIRNYFGNGEKFGTHIIYSYEKEILGTAGAVKKVEKYLSNIFFVIYGDVLSQTNLQVMLKTHNKHNSMATIGLYKVLDPARCGIVKLDRYNRIQKFVEKPKEIFSNLANAGVYVLNKEITKYIPRNKFYDFGRDLFPYLLNKGTKLYGYKINDYLIDMGTKKNYKHAQKEFK